ncbi:acyl transferase/acyl hydrolase/lysophospholipase [Plectosphaerella cucumerina]|uniref:Acyl transferase/acyl hydrolase/lysophospholipase n=1 Tax=Plectosphaerella cucumerina TaxID=40658 RepID=A0A8K0TJE0_9PEZI|nr:acyl transferase/acyl hydrolase/lysophospholipase [Plectosphaerella cucumerina]
MNDSSSAKSGLRLLSLDGGGIRGISSLVILHAIMEKVNEGRQATKLPKACFDLAGGTSTGGLIALMLFRLGMDTKTAISTYEKMAKKVFSPRLPHLHEWGYLGYCIGNPYLRAKALFLPSRFSDTYLKEAIHDIMAERGERGDGGDAVKLRKPGTGRMFMCATSINHECAVLFRSLAPPPDATDDFADITVEQAALATSAAPTYLPKVEVMGEEFWDGGLLNNNPINQVWDARYDLISISQGTPVPEPQVSCVVSIGTGRVKKPVQQSGWVALNTISTAVSYVTNTEAKHKDFCHKIGRLNARSERKICYFRFNVELKEEINLDDWQSMRTLKSITEDQLPGWNTLIEQCAHCLMGDCAEGCAHCLSHKAR